VKELLKLDSICQSYVQIKNVPVFWLCVYSWRDIGKPDVCLWTAYYRNAFAVVHKSILIQKTFHFFHFTVTANVDNFYIWCILYRVILQNNYWLIYVVSTATQPWVKLICCFGISFAQINTVSAHQMSEPLQRQIPKFIPPPRIYGLISIQMTIKYGASCMITCIRCQFGRPQAVLDTWNGLS